MDELRIVEAFLFAYTIGLYPVGDAPRGKGVGAIDQIGFRWKVTQYIRDLPARIRAALITSLEVYEQLCCVADDLGEFGGQGDRLGVDECVQLVL